jgi:hypothetical protein
MAKRKKPLNMDALEKFRHPDFTEGVPWWINDKQPPNEVPTPAGALMTAAEARDSVEKINNHATQIRALVLDLYERRGWEALGYSSWRACVVSEFEQSQSRLYQLLDAGKVERNLSNMLEKPLSNRAVEELKALEPEQQREVWKEATQSNPKPSDKEVKTAVAKITGKVEAAPAQPATKPVENKPVAKKAVAKAVQSSGTVAQLPVSVPARLLRGIITSDMYAKGFAVYSDVAGNPCQLAPDVSELEHRERAPQMIGGSGSAKHRKAYTKWERYHGKKIRQKVLQVLELMSPLEVPKDHKAEEFVYNYDLENPDDLEELATMLNADLMRLAQARRQILKYGTEQPPRPEEQPKKPKINPPLTGGFTPRQSKYLELTVEHIEIPKTRRYYTRDKKTVKMIFDDELEEKAKNTTGDNGGC